MKKIIISAVVCAVAVAGGSAWAGRNHQMPVPPNVKAGKVSVAEQVIVYSKPSKRARVLQRVLPGKQLVPFYTKGEWMKVGLGENGQVGWVNKAQFRAATAAFYRPDIRAVFIHREVAPNGKPIVNIVAYHNGQRLTQGHASRLYDRLMSHHASNKGRRQGLHFKGPGMTLIDDEYHRQGSQTLQHRVQREGQVQSRPVSTADCSPHKDPSCVPKPKEGKVRKTSH